MRNVALVFASWIFSSMSFAGVCKVDDRCQNHSSQYRIVDASTDRNILGTCFESIEGTYRAFRQLEQTGQCSRATATEECVISTDACVGRTGTFHLDYKPSGNRVTWSCHENVSQVRSLMEVLVYTGQCKPSVSPTTCGIDGMCKNDNYPYRVIDRGSNLNLTAICYATLDMAFDAYSDLKSAGLCQ